MGQLGAAGIQRLPFGDDLRFRRVRAPAAIGVTASVTEHFPAAAVATWSTRVQAMVLDLAAPPLRDRLLPGLLAGTIFGSIGMSEPDAGTDLRGVQTVLTPVDGGYRLDGHKTWLTLGPLADFSLVLSKIGTTARDADMALVLVERSMDGVTYSSARPLVAYPGLPMGDLCLDGVEVPDSHVLLPTGGLAATLGTMSYARLEAASHGCGLQRVALRALDERTRTRETDGRPIRSQSHVRHALGGLRTQLAASEALTLRAAELYGSGSADGDLPAMAKVFATDAAVAGAHTAMSMFGSFGLLADSVVAEVLLAATAAQVVDGTNDVMLMAAARALSGAAVSAGTAPEVALRQAACATASGSSVPDRR